MSDMVLIRSVCHVTLACRDLFAWAPLLRRHRRMLQVKVVTPAPLGTICSCYFSNVFLFFLKNK